VVLADGSIVTANAQQHRGGGGNFGIVTRFTFRLHAVAPMMAGFVMYPASQAVEVLGHFDQLTRKAPQELSLVAALVSAPPAPFVPETLHFQPVVAIAACYVGPVEEGAAAVQALREFGAPAVDTFGVQNYVDIQQWDEPEHQAGVTPSSGCCRACNALSLALRPLRARHTVSAGAASEVGSDSPGHG